MTDDEEPDFGGVDYDAATGTYSASFAGESPAPSTVIPRVVAAVTGRRVDGLPLLHDAVDPDALDDLLGGADDPCGPTAVVVEFAYAECDVTVRSSGEVVIGPPETHDPN